MVGPGHGAGRPSPGGSGGFSLARTGSRAEVKASAASLPDAFARAALGVFALVAGPADASERGAPREVRAHGRSVEELLARWIGECLYVHEIEGFVPDSVEFAAFSSGASGGGEALRLHAFLRGREAGPPGDQPGPSLVVQEASVRSGPEGVEASVVLDISPA